MSLNRDEVELLARRRMLTNLLDDVMEAVAAENPRLHRQLDEMMLDYLEDAQARCGELDNAQQALECIMDTKREHEPQLRDELRGLIG